MKELIISMKGVIVYKDFKLSFQELRTEDNSQRISSQNSAKFRD